MSNELEHYGVLGMKWGVRRYQPYPDGKHGRYIGERSMTNTSKIGTAEQWKDKQKYKIDKMYDATYRRLEKIQQKEPDNKEVSDYRKQIEKQHAQDLKVIDGMTFAQVEEARNQERLDAKERQKAAIKSVGGVALWSGKMALLGVRLGGTAALLAAVANGGNKLFSYLGSDEGMATIKAAGSLLRDIGNNELSALSVLQNYISNKLPGSIADVTLSQIDFDSLLPEAASAAGNAATRGIEKAVERNTDEVLRNARRKIRV